MNRITHGFLVVAAALVFVGSAEAFSVPFSSGAGFGAGPTVTGSSYAEVGDAGAATNPQDVVGTDLSLITGDIGGSTCTGFCIGPLDEIDAFRFYFSGGDIEFIGVLHLGIIIVPCPGGCGGGGVTSTFALGDEALPLSLFSASNASTALTPDVTTTPSWDIEFNNLAAGNYIIQATFLLLDPPYDITIITDGVVGAAIPEPATLALLGLGLAGLGFSRGKQ